MTDLIIRDLDPQTAAQIAAQASHNGRTFEAEARSILEQAAVGKSALSVIETIFPAETRLSDGEHRDLTAAIATIDTVPEPPSLQS